MVRTVVLRKALSRGVAAVRDNRNCNLNVAGLKKPPMAAALLCLALAFLPGCATSKSGNGSGNNGPQTVSPIGGSPQNTLVGVTFGAPLSVVVDQNGTPVPNVSVTFAAPSTGPTGTFKSNGKNSESVTTDANGHATSSAFTASGTAGAISVTATIAGGSAPAQFALTSYPASAATISAAGGSPQSALIDTAFSQLSVVIDLQGSPVPNVSVTFNAPNAGASGAFKNGTITETDVTDATGVATASTFTANGIPGAYAITGGISGGGTPASFALTNTVLTLTATAGTGQSTKVGTGFTNVLKATVIDHNGNPVSGAAVTFTAPPSSGASGLFFGGKGAETDNTDPTGVATSSTFTANANVGSYNVVATVPSGAGPANFNLNNTSSAAAGVFATGGVVQNAAINTAFGALLVATVVDGGGSPVAGVPVTFTAPPPSGASGTFGGSGTFIVSTDSNGNATSSFTANANTGTYTVTATTGSLSPANFLLTNTSATLTSYVFYVSGQSLPHPTGTTNYYAIAGAITVDQLTGAVIGGEEDYNDANGYTYAQVPITGGTFSVSNTTGQGTFSLSVPSQPTLGNSGTETFGVQFVNSNHALIMQFDGSATSSGSLDLQNFSTPPSGSYAFTMSGTDPAYAPVALGGVFAFNGNLLNPSWPGTIDLNDGSVGVNTGNAVSAGVSGVDQFGRGQITGINIGSQGFVLNYYQLGPEVLRIIDMDANIAAVGSAFGQGTNAANTGDAALGNSVFGVSGSPSTGNPDSIGTTSYAALGQFTTDGAGTLLSGVGDEKELGINFLIDIDLSSGGSYHVGPNGYGTLTLPASALGNVNLLALYLTDPNLNLNDPNNTSGGGGGLLLDLDAALPGGTGFVVPQTDALSSSFTGHYAAAWQNLNSFHGTGLEFDILGQGTMTPGNPSSLSLTGLVSDPFGILLSTHDPLETSGVSFQSAPDTDGSHPGRYTMLGANNPSNLLSMTNTTPAIDHDFNVVVYQASGSQLFWLDVDNNGSNFDAVFLGPLQQQGSLTGIPLIRSGSGKLQEGISTGAAKPILRTK